VLKSHNGRVFYREWICDNPKAVIILVHGLGGYSGRFFELGPLLVKNGFKPYAIELKGFGESPAIKGHIENFKIYTGELKSLVRFAKNKNPGKKIFVLGESMGGLITLDFSLHYQNEVDGIILISLAIKDKLPINMGNRIRIFFSSIFKPLNYFNAQFDASMFTRDPRMAERINDDPLEVRNLTAKFFLSIFKTLIYVNMSAKKLKLPALFLLAGCDRMISAEAAEAYFKRIPSKDKELKWYPEMFHALYVDKGRENVFEDILNWLERHL
jgi:alpha-beta hydrolase superfamily lysophospholipase